MRVNHIPVFRLRPWRSIESLRADFVKAGFPCCGKAECYFDALFKYTFVVVVVSSFSVFSLFASF